MRKVLYFPLLLLLVACNSSTQTSPGSKDNPVDKTSPAGKKHFRGALTGGLKGDSLSFDISADGRKVENLTFNGYWRCDGKLERLPAAGPDGAFNVINGKVDEHISEPPNGGATSWRFDLKALIENNTASGSFRMNINNLGCDTYLLKFTAVAD